MGSLAEKTLIGYLMTDNQRIADVANVIDAEMFTVNIYRDIFQAMLDNYAENIASDIVSLSPLLLEKNYDEEAINTNLFSAVRDLDFTIGFKSCIESIKDAYKAKVLGEKYNRKMQGTNEVNDVIKQMITELEVLLGDNKQEVVSVSDMVDRNKDKYFKPGVDKLKVFFGLNKLDEYVGGVEGGDITILAARPAVGKSAMALQIVEYNALNGKKVCYINLEMQEKQIYERMLAKASKIDMLRIRNAVAFLNDEEEKFKSGNEKLKAFGNIHVRNGSARVSDIRSCVKNGNYDLVVIDYLQLVKPDKGRGSNRYAEVGDISRGIKAIAMDYDVPIIALSQLNRASEGKEDKEPTMSELRESGDIEQDASVIIMLWNSDMNDKSKKRIKVDKARQGKLGSEDIVFNGSSMTFESLDGFAEADDNPFT